MVVSYLVRVLGTYWFTLGVARGPFPWKVCCLSYPLTFSPLTVSFQTSSSVRLRHVLSPSAQWTTRRVKWTLLTFAARTSLISWIKSTTTLSCTISSAPMSWPAGCTGQVQILIISNITNAWSVLLNKRCRGRRKQWWWMDTDPKGPLQRKKKEICS